MTIGSSTQPSLRARLLPRFPANVLAGNGITITKSGGTYVFSAAAFADIPLSALESMAAGTVVARGVGAGSPSAAPVSGGLGFTGAGSLELTENQRIRLIHTNLYDPANIPNGVRADIYVPFSGTIIGVTMLASGNSSGSIDLWKAAYAAFPPTVANSIVGGTIPTFGGTNKYRNTTLSGWDTTVSAGDIIRLNASGGLSVQVVFVGLDLRTA
jgi:hypothetical protein